MPLLSRRRPSDLDGFDADDLPPRLRSERTWIIKNAFKTMPERLKAKSPKYILGKYLGWEWIDDSMVKEMKRRRESEDPDVNVSASDPDPRCWVQL
ncbi:uncharacterized protein LOC62_05G007737 [Vanrija pseudolonga]|uniref:Uncharacterized protein n=1 Tax=Vanrija pseudolonga TaxID=143232 RepID=A0AAF0YG33_9TREE|nr:hypothetical protein LOC62_05G007737 [Vanrija pseudolonga]